MVIYAIIPARMGASRFPGKPLALIDGMPMLEHVVRRTQMAHSLTATYVATCDAVIANYCRQNGIKVVMTHADHTRCTDRCAEALPYIEALEGRIANAVVIVQGDEPMVHPHMVDAALTPLQQHNDIHVVNLLAPILSYEEALSPNTIKVVTDAQGKALYFSRALIPYAPSAKIPHQEYFGHKQVCIMPFRRQALLDFIALPPTPLELAESVDMLRLLEHGYAVHLVPTQHQTQSVDCLADLERVVSLMQNDALRLLYRNPNTQTH